MLLTTFRKSLSAFPSRNIFNQYKNLYHNESVSFHASTEKVVGASTEEALGFSTGCSSEYSFGVGIVIVTVCIHYLFLLWCLFLKHYIYKDQPFFP